MAQVTIKSVVKRVVTLDVTWSDGLSATDVEVTDVPVEDFAAAQAYLFAAVSGIYNTKVAEKAAADYANPTPAPEVLAAVGQTFNDDGSLVV